MSDVWDADVKTKGLLTGFNNTRNNIMYNRTDWSQAKYNYVYSSSIDL